MSKLPSYIGRLALISLIFVHLVIIAGSVVRMTGSGMGCPDWPKCFGYTIPPTHIDHVTWHASHDFKKGQMIVHPWHSGGETVDRLLVAQRNHTSGVTFDAEQWRVYDKHDYSIFNPVHTWIEFINRLIGALTGVPVLLLFGASVVVGIRRRLVALPLLSAGVLFMLGFEAWLGKLVVDGNLIPGSITIHMLGAVVLVALLLVIMRLYRRADVELPRAARWLLIASLVLALVQIILGTRVREEIDVLSHEGLYDRSEWINQLSNWFDAHRSFSWLVLLLNAGWIFIMRRAKLTLVEANFVIALLGIQLIGGIVLTYAGMPAGLQPLHLFAGIVMFGVVWHAVLRTRAAK